MWSFLFKLAIGTIVAALIFDRVTRKYRNPYKLFLIFGKKGSELAGRLAQSIPICPI